MKYIFKNNYSPFDVCVAMICVMLLYSNYYSLSIITLLVGTLISVEGQKLLK